MKIFAPADDFRQHNNMQESPLYIKETPALFLMPDSALLKDGKPFFIPEWMGEVAWKACLVVRISRLGKSVPERFAYRYWDAATVGACFVATDILSDAERRGMPWTVAVGFDNSAFIGRWIAKEGLAERDPAVSIRVDGSLLHETTFAEAARSVDSVIARTSEFFTMRTGDLFFISNPFPLEKAEQGRCIEAAMGGEDVLTCRMK